MHRSWIGKTIGGRYQIDALLGQGGMSAVYRAMDPNLRRQVAVKLIHTHLATNPNFVSRFKEEAAAVARLRHPNIVQVHDFNNDGDTYYMVMEYLIGETLQTRLERLDAVNRHMPFDEAIMYCGQLCDAVGYAHRHDLVHRDIKPANIMLDMNRQAILMDFGIVKIIGGEYHTATGATVGTAKYMSPEQMRNERADERSDIYSLGVTLYEMIAGRTPYQADSALALMMMALNDPLPDVHEFRRGIPEALSKVIKQALAKEPKDRFQTMEEMATALQQAQETVQNVAPAATVVDEEYAERPQAADRLVGELSGGDAIVAKQTPAGAERRRESPAKVQQDRLAREERATTAIPTVADLPAATVDASQRQAVSASAGVNLRLNRRRIIIVAAVLLLLASAIVIGIVYGQSQKAPESRMTSFISPAGPINDQTARSVVSLGQWETNSFIEDLAYSPDGKWIGTACNREVWSLAKYRFYGALWPVDADRSQLYLLGQTQRVYGVAFSPDGRFFATGSDDSAVILWQASDGQFMKRIETSSGGVSSLDFSPNGLLLAVGGWDGSVGLWQVRDGHLLRTLQGHEDSVYDVAFSPDGNLLASASEDLSIKLWRVSDGSPVHTLRGHTGTIHELAFSPDGKWLASASEDKSIGLWDVEAGTMTQIMQGHSEPVLDVAFSADGSLLVSGSGDETLRLWRVADGEMLHVLSDNLDVVTSLAFSPDGNVLVSGQIDGVLHFWGISEAIQPETETSQQ